MGGWVGVKAFLGLLTTIKICKFLTWDRSNADCLLTSYSAVLDFCADQGMWMLKQPVLFPQADRYRYNNVTVGPMMTISVRN